MKIYIPHLHITVNVKDIKKSKGFKFKNGTLASGYVKIQDDFNIDMYLQFPIKTIYHGTIVHEVTHVMQFISRLRDIDFQDEMEHFGYLSQYIFNKIVGCEYK